MIDAVVPYYVPIEHLPMRSVHKEDSIDYLDFTSAPLLEEGFSTLRSGTLYPKQVSGRLGGVK